MPTGYPDTTPITVAPSETHGWPVLESGGWTTTLYPDGAAAAAGLDLAAYAGVRYWRSVSEPFVGADLGAYSPALALGYLRAFHRYLELLSRLTQPQGVAGYEDHSDGSELPGNFADQWTLRVTSQIGSTLTIQNSCSGCDDPRDLPITTSAGVNGARSCLQPWDVVLGPGWRAPWGIITRVSFGAATTTIYLHKAVALDTPCNVETVGNRYAKSNFDYPEPRTAEGARCLHCRLDPTGSLASGNTTGLYSAADPAYNGAPSATYLGEHWYCAEMRTASGGADFEPGVCALGTDRCDKYEAAQPWPLIPAIALARVWLARNWYLGELIAGTEVYFAVRVEHPSLIGLTCGFYERYQDEYGLLSQRKIWHGDMDVWGKISGANHEWSQGVLLEDGSGVLVGAPARASWTGGTTADETDADAGSDRWKSMRCHALRRLGRVALNDPDARVEGPSEYAVQRRRRRVRIFGALSKTASGAVEHTWGTSEFHPSGKAVTATFTSGLTLALSRERSLPKGRWLTIPGSPPVYVNHTGTVWKSEITADGLLKVQFLPGACDLEWVYTDPKDGDTDARTRTVLAGGNVVDAPFWSRVLNPASGRDYLGCVYERAQQGDAVLFDVEGATSYWFTVVRAEAHGGDKYSGTIGGISSATEPTSSGTDSTAILRGVPENWTPGASSVRLKADVVWLDWVGELGSEVVQQVFSGLGRDPARPGEGDVAVFAGASVLAPKWAYRDSGEGLAIEASGFGAFPVVTRHVGDAETTLTEGTDYRVDRATGVLEFKESLVQGWPSTRFAISVDGWMLEAPNEMQAEVLTKTQAALRRIDGCRLGTGDPVTLKVDGYNVTNTILPNNANRTYYYVRSDDANSDPVRWFADDSGGSYGRVGVTHELDSISQAPSITVDYSFWGRLPATPLASSSLKGWRPEWISQAWADFTVTGAMRITRRKDYLKEGIPQLIFNEKVVGDTRRVQIGTMTLTDAPTTGASKDTDINAIVSGGQSFALDHLDFSGKTVHTIDITGALRAACGQNGGIPYLVVTGPADGSIPGWDAGGESFRSLASPWVKSTTCNGVIGPGGEDYSALDVESLVCTFDVGITIQNLRLQIDWDAIETTDLPDLPYGNWPKPLA